MDQRAIEGHFFKEAHAPQDRHGPIRIIAGDLYYLPAHLRLLELVRGIEGNEAPLTDEPDALAQLGLVHVVGGDHDGHALLGHGIDEVPEPAAADGIDAGGGLVQKKDLGPVHDGTAQGQSLLPAAR